MNIINPQCGKTVLIAYQAENNRTQVRFDMSDIVREFPGGTAVLVIRRKGDMDPVPAAQTEMDGSVLVWTVTAWECAIRGYLYAQIVYSVGDVVAKTKIYRLDVAESMTVSGAEPEEWADLVGQLVTAAAGVNTAIEAAQEQLRQYVADAEAAERAAEQSATAAGTAQAAAETAQRAAEEAVGQYDDMTATATGLAAGSAPTAVMDHSGSAPVLRLGIPAGDPGTPGHSPVLTSSKSGKVTTIYSDGQQLAQISDGEDGQSADVIDDTAGAGDTDKTFSANKLTEDHSALLSAINEKFGRENIGDGLDVEYDETGEATVVADVQRSDITNLQQNKADIIITNASSSIAAITDGADDLPVESMTVQIEPVQDLHGQSNPYPAGGGKNLLSPVLYSGGSYNASVGDTFNFSVSQKQFTTTDNKVFTITTTSTWEGFAMYFPVTQQKYRLSGTIKSSDTLGVSKYYLDENFGVLYCSSSTTAEQSIEATWNADTAVSGNARYIAILFTNRSTANTTITVTTPMAETGTTTTDYAPYENICPISGWTGCNVTRAGKNLLPLKVYNGASYNAAVGTQFTLSENTVATKNDTSIEIDVSGWQGVAMLSNPLKPGSYYLYAVTTSTNMRMTRYVLDKDFKVTRNLGNTGSGTSATINMGVTIGTDERYILVHLASSTTGSVKFEYPQLELGSTATAYVPYQGSTYPITWDSAGTVYGGTLNPVTGELVVDYAIIDLGDYTYSYQNAFFLTTTGVNNMKRWGTYYHALNWYCDCFKVGTTNSAPQEDNEITATINNTRLRIKANSFSGNVTEFKNWVTGHKLVYELETPQTYTLTPTEIRTLLGYNTIFADVGDVSVDYRADTKLFVEKTEVSGVQDVKVNGSSVVTDGVANVPVAASGVLGVVKQSYGINIAADGSITTNKATEPIIKGGGNSYNPIVSDTAHLAVFYGLAKAARADMASVTGVTYGTYPDAQKVAIQKMLGIYEAPWELIREDTFTNETETAYDITVDSNGQPFELTDIRFMVSLPKQDNEAKIGLYGRIRFYFNNSNDNDICYIGGWTQPAGENGRGGQAEILQKDGMIQRSYVKNVTGGSDVSVSVNGGFKTGNTTHWQLGTKSYTKVRIDEVKGTFQYFLYGKRKWN